MENEITYGKMVKTLVKSGDTILSELTAKQTHNIHMVLGISGEVSELIEALVLSLVNGEEFNEDAVIKEFGDIEFYMEGYRQGFNLERVEIDELESEKLSEALPLTCMKLVVATGSLTEALKKSIAYNRELNIDVLKKALKEMDHLLGAMYIALELTREMALAVNMNKLSERYQGFTYSDNAAINRVDVA